MYTTVKKSQTNIIITTTFIINISISIDIIIIFIIVQYPIYRQLCLIFTFIMKKILLSLITMSLGCCSYLVHQTKVEKKIVERK